MAGRGVRINVTIDATGEDIEVFIARHSPLSLLKQKLSRRTGIAPRLQSLVLVLHDATDSMLLEDDHELIQHLGITHGSRLLMSTLSEVSPASQRSQVARALSVESPYEGSADRQAQRKLVTPVQPRDANHSYNGVMFDIKPKGPYEVRAQDEERLY